MQYSAAKVAIPFDDETRSRVMDEVVDWIEQGKTLRDYCRQEGKPKRRTIDDWRKQDESFSARFARARDIGFDQIAEETLAIADDGSGDTYEDDEGIERVNHDVIQRSRIRIETRLKLLAKWDPRRYGDRPVEPPKSLDDERRELASLYGEIVAAEDALGGS